MNKQANSVLGLKKSAQWWSARWPPLLGVVFISLQLAYEYATGGVQSHHLFADPKLPLFSNWLGILTLPVLGVLMAWRTKAHASTHRLALPRSVAIGFIAALLYGGALALGFELNVQLLLKGLFFGMFALALFLPLYRAEVLFGFVLGMSFTFGPVLPIIIGILPALLSWVVRSGLSWSVGLLKRA